MITMQKEYNKAGYQCTYFGLSTDTKPDAKNADIFYEMDTAKIYLYNEAGTTWIEQ